MKNLIYIANHIAVLLHAILVFNASASTDLEEELTFDPMMGEVPHVLSAVRLHQPTAEVPASVTVLDAEFIHATGAKNIQDLLRYVPGMLVVPEPYDNSDSVVYHGGPALYPKAMEVLIDGRTVYSSGLSAVGWDALPVSIDEIQRLEIVRGPNSTTYGTNAYQAVVNIITKHPADTLSDRQISLKIGNNGDHYLHGAAGFNAAGGQWRLSAVDKGTDHQDSYSTERIPCSNDCPDRRDSSHLSLRGMYELNSEQSLDVALVLAQAKRKLPHYTVNENEVEDQRYEFGFRYHYDLNPKHHLKISAFTYQYQRNQLQVDYSIPVGLTDPDLTALFRINPVAADQIAAGQTPDALDLSDPQQINLAQNLAIRYANPSDFLIPVAATSHSDMEESRSDIEVQDTYAITPNLTLLSGIGYRYDKVFSDTYYKGTVTGNSWRFFGNINWRAASDWTLHAGIMNEKSKLDNNALSFRAAANYLISPVESIRLVYSEATKTPDFIEQYADWTYNLEDIKTSSPNAGNNFYRALILDGDLESQHIRSYELGYYGRSQTYKTLWDIRVFHERLTDLIYLFPTVSVDKAYSDNSVNFYGVEWQISKDVNAQTNIRYIGAYTKANSNVEEGLTEEELLAIFSPLSQGLSLQTKWSSSVNSMISLFWIKDLGAPSASSDQTVNTHRVDLNIFGTLDSRSIREVTWAVSVQHDLSDDPYITNGRTYDQDTRFQFELGMNF